MSASRAGTWKKTTFGLLLGASAYVASAALLPPALAPFQELLKPSLAEGVQAHLPAVLALGALVAYCSYLSGRALRRAVLQVQEEAALERAQLEEKNGLLSKLSRELEQAVTERNHRFSELFESMPGELLWANRDLRCVRVNSRWALAQGLYPRDFEGRPVGFSGRELDKHVRLVLKDFFESEKSQVQVVWNAPVSGAQPDARVLSLHKIRNGQEALVLVQLASTVSSVGAQSCTSHASDAPVGVHVPLGPHAPLGSARLASLGEMVAGIAHEINNPLAIINGRVQILRTKTVSGQLTNEELLLALDKLSQTVFRVSKIITGLRSFVRPGTGEQPEDVVPARAIEDALDFCKGRFHKQNIRIVLEVTSTRLVRCVPVQLSQILLNLLNNSLHALDGCREKWVRIEAHDADDSVVFKVVDSGPGVPVDLAERIFEPFFTTKDLSKGTGLGLSISRGLAEANGGALVVERGAPHTTFVLTLPSVPDNSGLAHRLQSEVVPEELAES